jgi:hypothetical protein
MSIRVVFRQGGMNAFMAAVSESLGTEPPWNLAGRRVSVHRQERIRGPWRTFFALELADIF